MVVHKSGFAVTAAALLLASVAAPVLAQAPASPPPAIVPGPTPVTPALSLPAATNLTAQTMVADLEAPWGMAFLPNGDLLVTELLGKLRYVKAGQNWSLEAEEIKGVPTVTAAGQGGLMDVTLHPNFARNKLIYLSFSVGDEAANRTRIVRAKLDGRALTDVQTIFEVTPAKPRFQHYGSRFTWLPDQTLLISIGDGGNPPNSIDGSFIRNQAQNLGSHLGKIIRIKDDGSIPKDNPFVNTPGARPEIYSYGHRNAQGLVRDPVSGRIYATEHGSQGGDELNLIQSGQNYGWPKVTYGVEYGAARTPITPNQSGPSLIDPLAVWSPAIAPSGLAVVRSKKYRGWDGDVLAGGLRLDQGRGALIRVDLDTAGKVIGQERIDLGDVRVRDVRQGPDGYIYVLTTAMRNFRDKGQRNGQLIRLMPANEAPAR
ncbi:PQQ-dependent sugar dehydrogenase [Aquidulcibacter sp.]|uniref:PQQ-dependent sugar dehydrogenase n=1 Tax=Aquidulcibacter sp. TaxID=2052990 RepID=UPI003BA54D1B